MTDTNTSTTVSSSSPSVQLGTHKAWIAAVAGAVVGAGNVLLLALSDGAIDLGEGINIILAGLTGAGIVGIPTWAKSTTVTLK